MESSTGSIAKKSRVIIKTVLKNKSTEEKCNLMDMMEGRQQFPQTELALNWSKYELLNIFDYIKYTGFEIDEFMLNKFWQCITENQAINIDSLVLEWLGYDSEHEYTQKQVFLKLLKSHSIEFQEINHQDPEFENYPDLVEEAKHITPNNIDRKKWIIMGSRDFKRMVMCLRTKKADDIRNYYLAIEDLFKMYCEYTLHFQMRREKERLEKKQCRIDELIEKMDGMELKHQERHDHLIKRADQLLHHAEQTEDDLQHITGKLDEVRDVAVPKPQCKKKLHKLGLIRKSPKYVRAEEDPKYYARSDVTVIRRQAETFNQRVNEIRNYGNGSNADARMCEDAFESPNAINLFNRLKEVERSPFVFHSPCGIELTEEGTEDRLLEEVYNIHREREQLP